MTYSSSRGRPLCLERESGQQRRQILTRECPLKRARGGFVSVLEAEQRRFEGGEVSEVAGRQHLALDDGKVDLDLIQPTRMNRREAWNQVRPLALQALGSPRPAMARAVVHNPEDATGGSVRLLRHHLRHESIERGDAG